MFALLRALPRKIFIVGMVSSNAGIASGRVLNAKHATVTGSSSRSLTWVWNRVAGGCIFFMPHCFVSFDPPRPPDSFPVLPSQNTSWMSGYLTPVSYTAVASICCVPGVASSGKTIG
jgi:hypothetical protein